jgi:hypothetical protein
MLVDSVTPKSTTSTSDRFGFVGAGFFRKGDVNFSDFSKIGWRGGLANPPGGG